MSSGLFRASVTFALFAFVACKAEVSGTAPDAGNTTMDAGNTFFPDGGAPTDGGTNCPPKYATGNLGGLDCDPMVPEQCGFPFPSNVYLTANYNSQTCFNVSFGSTTLPVINGNHINPSAWSDSDGWSPGTAAVTYLAGATTTGLPDQNNIASSVDAANSPTLLVDTSTSPPTLVPHFAELDVTDSNPTDSALLIHPVIRLKDNTRYIVAVRNVKNSGGTVIAPSPTFQALRDGTAAPTIDVNGQSMTDPSVASRQALYADIFTQLQAAGIDKSTLQIAWDYTTASKQNNVGQLESMYEQSLQAIPATGPVFTITSSVDNPDSLTARRIRGLITVPLFLDHAAVALDLDPLNPDITTGYQMARDSSGNPIMNGTGQFEFIVNIPAQATTSIAPLPILIQGHGLFSDRSEGMDAMSTTYDNLVLLAQNQGYITISLDLLGWRTPGATPSSPYGNGWPADWNTYGDTNQEDDQEKAGGFVSNDVGGFRRMIDRGTQGMLNQLIAVKMMETSFATDPHVMIGPNNQSVIDTTRAYYRGDSQGGILGITFMALTRDCLRGFLGEPGMPYNLLLLRSKDFSTFLSILIDNYSSGNPAMNVQVVLGLMQMYWDRLEGDGFAPYISQNTVTFDTPAHHVFIVDSLGDQQVTPLGTHILARTIGAKQLTPKQREIYGITDMAGPFSGNSIQEFDFGILTDSNDTVPQTDTPPTGPDDPHDWARIAAPTYLETDTFLKTGEAVDYCGGTGSSPPAEPTACVFPTGAP
jgi:hypothetical protein